MKTEAIVDHFADAVRQDGIPMEAVGTAPWFDAFEAGLPRRFPASFSSLYSRYRFPAFERGGLYLFGNLGDGSDDELAVASRVDPGLTAARDAGVLQIGRPDTGQYDLVCLDSRGRKNRQEYPLVLLDHEVLLQFNRISVMQIIDQSFLSFMVRNAAAA
jgi:hypothetical protein